MKITSTAFPSGGMIPSRHTCTGEDVSPPLAFHDVPAGTRSLALLVDDPDAPRGTWDHWVVWNLPADTRELELGWGGRPPKSGAVAGSNSWGQVGWRGPCPPFGEHRYVFRLYALDEVLDLPPGAPGEALRTVAGDHALATAELVGRFERAPGSEARSRVRDV